MTQIDIILQYYYNLGNHALDIPSSTISGFHDKNECKHGHSNEKKDNNDATHCPSDDNQHVGTGLRWIRSKIWFLIWCWTIANGNWGSGRGWELTSSCPLSDSCAVYSCIVHILKWCCALMPLATAWLKDMAKLSASTSARLSEKPKQSLLTRTNCMVSDSTGCSSIWLVRLAYMHVYAYSTVHCIVK